MKQLNSFCKKNVFWIVVGLVILIRITNLFSINIVFGQSMEPTLHEGNIVLSSSFPLITNSVQRGDIVVVEIQGKHLIKRLIAKPNDVIDLNGKNLTVNGRVIHEDQVRWDGYDVTMDINSYVLDYDEYIVMGDNRGHSTDSRYFGPVKESQIKSVVIFPTLSNKAYK